MLGRLAHKFQRFPLLLKFLDVHEMLSVQVHPTKANKNLLPAGETAKTEAWVVLEAGTRKAASMQASSQRQLQPICGWR